MTKFMMKLLFHYLPLMFLIGGLISFCYYIYYTHIELEAAASTIRELQVEVAFNREKIEELENHAALLSIIYKDLRDKMIRVYRDRRPSIQVGVAKIYNDKGEISIAEQDISDIVEHVAWRVKEGWIESGKIKNKK